MQGKTMNPGKMYVRLLLTFLLVLAFGVLPATAQNRDLTMVVLVNSANTVGYNTSTTSPGEYQRYPERYLEHLQIPYRVIDVSTTAPPDLSTVQLVVAGHRGLNLSSAWQNAILSAVQVGTGFVNLDSDPAIGNYTHIRTIFNATSSSLGTPSTSITVPLAVMQGGATPHYITKLQTKVPSDPAGDLVYSFHMDDNDVTGTATATLLNGSNATVLVKVGTDPLVMVTTYGSGRAVYFSTYDYLHADRFGFMMGLDDIFWRSLVWAARKPFVLRGYPRMLAIQQDDPVAGWATRVQDLYNPTYTGNVASDGTGGPWHVTGFIQEVNLDPGSSDRSSVISDINANKLHVAMHTNTGGSGGDLYWTGENSAPLTDSQWNSNLNTVLTWVQGNGGSDVIPLSSSLVPHFWDLSNNTGYDIWNKLGVRYLTEIQKPGSYYSSAKTNKDRLSLHPFRIYELPPTYGNPAERWPIYYADDITVGSRSGLPSQTFFSFATQLLGYTYPTFDASWPQDQAGISVAESLENFQQYTWRFWSGMAPVQIYTHDGGNMEHSTDAERQQLVTQFSQWAAARGVRHTFMSDLGAYMRARTKSVLSTASASSTTITLNFTGAALDANGTPVATKAYIFYGDDEGSLLSVNGFSNGTTATFPNSAPPMLVLNKASLTYNALPGGANPASQTFTVSNGGTGTMTWTASENASWLSISPSSGTNSGTVTVSVNTTGLASGTYTAPITVTAGAGATNSPQVINVTLFLNNPQLTVSPTSFAFSGFQGQGNPGASQLNITNTGGGSLNWTAASDSGWLTVSPVSGSAPSTLAIQPSISGLAIGTYTGHITITASGAQNSPTVIPVTLTVSGVLMSSNFNDGTLNGWVASPMGRFSSWSVPSGVLTYAGGGATQIYAGNANWTDYDFQTQIAFTTLNDYPGGIRGRVNPATGASYALWFYPVEKTVKLYKVPQWNIDSGFTTLGVAGLVSIDTAMHTVRMSFSGSTITVYYDGTQLLSATDTSYTSGLVALDVSSQPVQFDNILVSGNTGAQPTLTGPSSLTFSQTAGGAAPAPQTISLGTSSGTLSFSAASDSTWLTVGTTQGMTPASITASVSGSGLAAGNYLGHVNVYSPAASNTPLSIPVNFSVQASPATINLSATTVSFTAAQGQSAPTPQTVNITNSGGGTMNWTATPSAAWIQVSPGSGLTPGSVSISVSQAGLAIGTYTGSVTIAASGATNTPQTITVNMNVVSQDLNETFSNGANGWVISPMGNASGWSVSGGAYTYSGIGTSQSCAGNAGWTDYTYMATVKLTNLSNYPGGIRGRVNTAGAGYSLWLYPGNSLMKLFRTAGWNIDGSGTVLLATAAQAFDTNPHTLRMDFLGSSIYVYWDGVLTTQATDTGLTGGFVCLEGASAPITFDNVQVLGPIANPQVTATPTTLSFAAQQGAVAPSQTVQLTAGTAGMVFSATSDSPWLTVAASGMTTSPATLTVTASATSLASGSYTGHVIVNSPGAPNTPVSIPVTFSVGSASMVLSPASFNLVGATTQNPPPVSVTVSNGGTGALTWSASPTVSWLTPSPTTGTAPSSTSVTVASNTLAVGTYTGAVTFSSGQAGNSPLSATFNLRVGNLLFSDDFSAGSGNWTVSPLGSPANWSVTSGGYAFNGANPSQSYAGSASWTDYTFSTDVKLASLSNYPGGVRVRVNPSTGAGYAIWLYPGNGVIKVFRTAGWNIDGSGTTLLAQSGTVAFDATAAHNIRVDVQGANISVYYDNVLAVSTTDATYSSGVVALDGSGQPVTYDNVRVVSY